LAVVADRLVESGLFTDRTVDPVGIRLIRIVEDTTSASTERQASGGRSDSSKEPRIAWLPITTIPGSPAIFAAARKT